MTLPAANEKSIEKNSLQALSENLIKLLKDHNTNESELSRNLNITYNTIHRLIGGSTVDPKLSTLQQIADYFNVSLDALLAKQQNITGTDREGRLFIPIVTWDNIQAPNFFCEFQPESWSKWLPVATNDKKTINKNCYAIESTRSMQPRFPIGTTFIINPEEPPLDGDLVIVKFKEDQSVSFRELVIDSPDWQLYPIISGSKNLVMDRKKVDVIGVVVLTLIQTRSN